MGRLSNTKLAALGRQYIEIRAQLLDELVRRGLGTLEHDGVKLTARTKTTRTYHVPDLSKLLSRGWLPIVLPRRVDTRALAKAVRDGDVAQADVDACLLNESESAPFLEVTLR